MFKVGDKIKVGPLQGEIVEVYKKTPIGFNTQTKISYDSILKEVPEQTIKQEENGTD